MTESTGSERESLPSLLGVTRNLIRKRVRNAVEGLATFVASHALQSQGWRRRVWLGFQGLLGHYAADPAWQAWVHGRYLWLPISHRLPIYLRDFPLYDSLPARLGRFVRQRYGALTCIDVGANVGDTIAALRPVDGDRFLAIEPSAKFCACLKRNFESAAVEVVQVLLAAEGHLEDLRVVERGGTASAVVCEGSESTVEVKTLDQLVSINSPFAMANLLKIDTDGSDFEVLKGAHELLESARPVVVIECDSFDRQGYVDDVLAVLALAEHCGYGSVLVYDNFGYLMTSVRVSDASTFLHLLFYQLTSPFFYFDLVFLTDADAQQFLEEERVFLAGRGSGAAGREALRIVELDRAGAVRVAKPAYSPTLVTAAESAGVSRMPRG